MHVLQSGVDLSVIAIWLGHESTETTHLYVEAGLTMKEKEKEKGVVEDRGDAEPSASDTRRPTSWVSVSS